MNENRNMVQKVSKRAFLHLSGSFGPKQEFSTKKGFCHFFRNHLSYHFKSFPAESNDWKSKKMLKGPFLGKFFEVFSIFSIFSIFLKNRASSLFKFHGPLTSCKKSEKTNEPILRKSCHRQTDRHTDTQTGLLL